MDEKRESGYWLIFLLVVGLTVLYADRHGLYERYQAYHDGQEQIREAERQCESLKAQIDESRRRVEYLHGDSLEIEDAIRRNKNLVREGEVIYRIEDSPKPAAH